MPMSETDPNELVHYSVENKVATISLDRLEKLNAFTDEPVVALNNDVAPVRCRSRGVHSDYPRSRTSLLDRCGRAPTPA